MRAGGNSQREAERLSVIFKIAYCLSVRSFNQAMHLFYAATDSRAENDMLICGHVIICRDTADIFIEESGNIGEHMVVSRAETVPAFPERICTHIYPVLIAREGRIFYEFERGAYLAAHAERIENGFVSEHAEIKMSVLLGYLFLKACYERCVFILFTKSVIYHNACCRLAIALYRMRAFIIEFASECFLYAVGKGGIFLFVLCFAEKLCPACKRADGGMIVACIAMPSIAICEICEQ